MQALVIGCGYLGRRVATIWRTRGARVSALTRSVENAAVLRKLEIEPVVGDVMQPSTLRSLPSADIVLYAVGYDPRAGLSKSAVYLNGLENVLRELNGRIGTIHYVSSTSVYGQQTGEWVDETSPCAPTTIDGRICLAAENAIWRQFPPRSRAATVLRFSGIYGPGRLLRRLDSICRNEPIQANPDAFLNLIHVDDGARIVAELAERGRRGTTYLVTDDRPVRRREYYGLMARLVGVPEPSFQPAPADGSRFNKRCSNRRLREELGDIYQYPTIESGLPHAIRAEP